MGSDSNVYCANTGHHYGRVRMSDYDWGGMVNLVLTIAHLGHVPENCNPTNVRALCRRCHLAYDAEHHRRNAAKIRRDRKAVADLFDE